MPEFIVMRILFSLSFLLLWFEVNCGALKSKDIGEPKLSGNQLNQLIYAKGVVSNKEWPLKSSPLNRVDLEKTFKNLSNNDLAFIKDLDQQFVKYGAKLKIKIANSSVTGKRKGKSHLKRTLDKNLGYGYPQQYDTSNNNYEYTAPKYMVYPYSQEDIVPQNANYYLPQRKPITTVSIEPSYSFELQTETYIEPAEHQSLDDGSTYKCTQNIREEPVLVLNVPGNQEYANHLKNLLQQYLELKTTQYLQYFNEQNQSNNVNEVETIPGPQSEPVQHIYQNQNQNENPIFFEQNSKENYNEDFNDDRSYYTSTSTVNNGPKYYENYEINAEQSGIPLLYYAPDKQYRRGAILQDGQNSQDVNNNLTQVFLLTAPMKSQSPHLVYVTENYNQKTSGDITLPLTENNPRKSHTKVIFTQNTKHASSDYQPDYLLPSIRPQEYYPAASIPVKHQDFQMQDTSKAETVSNNDKVITITQRPFNYHTQNTKQYSHGRHDIMVLTTYK